MRKMSEIDEIIYKETQKAAYEEQCEQEFVHQEQSNEDDSKMEVYEMLGLLKRQRYRNAARRKYVERWEKLGDELHNNVDNTMRKLWKQTLENKEFLEELEKKHKKVK